MRDRLYLDACVLNRPSDDQTQERIHLESVATATMLEAVAEGRIEWIASPFLVHEISQNPNRRKRRDTLQLLSLATTIFQPTSETHTRAAHLQAQGYGRIDAFHLAIAEQAGASSLLTVDDRFLRRAATRPPGTMPSVKNPIDWMRRRHPWLIKR